MDENDEDSNEMLTEHSLYLYSCLIPPLSISLALNNKVTYKCMCGNDEHTYHLVDARNPVYFVNLGFN